MNPAAMPSENESLHLPSSPPTNSARSSGTDPREDGAPADENPFVPPTFERVEGLTWTAVHTKPRCEKQLARYCQRHSVPCYLPLRRRVQRYQRRTVTTFLPLFPGYVFVQLHPEQYNLIYNSHKAVRILPVDPTREARLIADLQNVRRIEVAGRERPVEVHPQIVPGRVVRIRTGLLRGVEGIVQKIHGKARVIVNVEMLGHSVAVDMDVSEVDSTD